MTDIDIELLREELAQLRGASGDYSSAEAQLQAQLAQLETRCHLLQGELTDCEHLLSAYQGQQANNDRLRGVLESVDELATSWEDAGPDALREAARELRAVLARGE
jgi:chromosome segregation ATPase